MVTLEDLAWMYVILCFMQLHFKSDNKKHKAFANIL